MLDLLELVLELQANIRVECYYDDSERLWQEYISYNPLIQDMEHTEW